MTMARDCDLAYPIGKIIGFSDYFDSLQFLIDAQYKLNGGFQFIRTH